MGYFTNLTTSLQQKWWQFFQTNRSWIARQMELEHVATPDGGRRPSSHLILGVINVLEPQLPELMEPFTKLNADGNAMIDVLGLNFDPEQFQGNYSDRSANPDPQMDTFMGLTNDEDVPENLSDFPRVEVVNKTALESSQQQSLEPPDRQELGDAWLEQGNPGTNSEPERTPDKNSAREEKKSEDEEISRLFPDF